MPGSGLGRLGLRALADVTAVLRLSLAVLWRHWPVLFALSFGGLAARSFLGEAAVRLSRVDSVLGLLVFILVPITTLAALILMMWTIRSSLAAKTVSEASVPGASVRGTFGSEGPAGPGAARRMLNLIGSVLIPFLAVYASYGYLQADRASYMYATWVADPTGPIAVPYRLSATLVVVVVLAVVLRTALGRWTGARSRPWLGILGGYLEIVWIGIAASLIGPLRAAAMSWLDDRRVVHGGVTAVNQLGDPVHGTLDWLGGLLDTLLGSADTVIVVPVAWLAVGAIVYGHRIGAELPSRDRGLVRGVTRRWVRLPKLARRAITGVRAGAEDRFGPLVRALRVLLRAGLPSMLLFCLLFLVTQTTGIWLFLLERRLIGPRDLAHFWMPLSDPLSVLNDGFRTVLLVCLLGGAVARVLQTGTQPAPIQPGPNQPAEAELAQAEPAQAELVQHDPAQPWQVPASTTAMGAATVEMVVIER